MLSVYRLFVIGTLLVATAPLRKTGAFVPTTSVPAKRCRSDLSLASASREPLTHGDILWKIRLPPQSSRFKRLITKLSAWGIRLDCKLRGQTPPLVLCPKGGQALLEAWHQRKRIGRFGITTEAGPCIPAMQQSVQDAFGIENVNFNIRSAAIIYMFVEEHMRGRNLGYLALEAIGLIHAAQGCDFTVLIADDKTPEQGVQKLVRWYENFGYKRAPMLQEPMGSPGEVYGVTMIGPTDGRIPKDIRIQWW